MAVFREQVALLPPPVVVVTHSQGAWIAWAALADGVGGVSDLVMLARFPRSPVSYPPAGVDGPGRVGSDALRLLSALGERLGVSTFDPDAPLARELQATPGAIEAVLARPLPRTVRALAVASRFDLPLMPGGWEVPGARNACPLPVTHVGLTSSASTHRLVRRFLAGGSVPACPSWRAWLGPVTEGFGVPPSDA